MDLHRKVIHLSKMMTYKNIISRIKIKSVFYSPDYLLQPDGVYLLDIYYLFT